MRRLRLFTTRTIGVLLCTLSMYPAAVAQVGAASEVTGGSGDVVVVGTRMKERRAGAIAYVRATGIARGQQPAARWVVPVCAKVSGVPPEMAAIVLERFRALATEVGAPLAHAGCTPNAIVNFTNDAHGFVNRVFARAPHQFKDVSADGREALLRGDAPIRWWHIIRVGDADGMTPVDMQPAFVQIGGAAGGQGLPMGDGGVQQRFKEGAISSQSTRAIVGASIVVDLRRTGPRGRLPALGDYAALVALAEFRPSAPPPSGSILGLFAEQEPAEAVTPNDVALLKQLYSIPLDREAKAHRRMLAKALVDAQTGRVR